MNEAKIIIKGAYMDKPFNECINECIYFIKSKGLDVKIIDID